MSKPQNSKAKVRPLSDLKKIRLLAQKEADRCFDLAERAARAAEVYRAKGETAIELSDEIDGLLGEAA